MLKLGIDVKPEELASSASFARCASRSSRKRLTFPSRLLIEYYPSVDIVGEVSLASLCVIGLANVYMSYSKISLVPMISIYSMVAARRF